MMEDLRELVSLLAKQTPGETDQGEVLYLVHISLYCIYDHDL